MGALTVAVVTTLFAFEGAVRAAAAQVQHSTHIYVYNTVQVIEIHVAWPRRWAR